jgi:hypothetical protein
MYCFLILVQPYGISSKRLDLLEKFICICDNYAMHSQSL